MYVEKNTGQKYAICAYLYRSGNSVELINLK